MLSLDISYEIVWIKRYWSTQNNVIPIFTVCSRVFLAKETVWIN